MHRTIPKFVLLVTLAVISPLAVLLLSAPTCRAQSQDQQDQHNQPGQQPAQQPTLRRNNSLHRLVRRNNSNRRPRAPHAQALTLMLPRSRPRKRRCLLRTTTPRPLPKTPPKNRNPACSRPKTIPPGTPSTRNRILTSECSTCTKGTWTPPSAASKTPSAFAPISPSRAYC